MARFTAFFVALALSVSQLNVHAAPLSIRADGGNFVQCNVARLKTVAGLSSTTSALKQITSTDSDTSAAVTAAQAGLKDAQSGVVTIAKALLSGQAAPSAAREQVGQGLLAAHAALEGVSASDNSVTTALTKLEETIAAGQQVVAKCGSDAVEEEFVAPSTAPADAAEGTLTKRQIGGLRCNIARLQTVRNLSASTKAVKNLSATAQGDTLAMTEVQNAMAGLQSAKDGVSTIARAIVTGQQAPASARDQVGQGLNAAQTSLNSIQSSDPAINDGAAAASAMVGKTLTAGAAVVANC